MELFHPPFNRLDIDTGEIYRTLGFGGRTPDPVFSVMIDSAMEECRKIALPQAGYIIVPVSGIEGNILTVGGVAFKTGGIITSFFRDAEEVALFVSTAGREFDQWLHELKSEGDIMREFIVDAIGSEIAEASARYIAGRIEEYAQSNGCNISNSYSPGYCGWHVREQESLFGLLPAEPCGITLNDSCLMTPVKSVSGMIGIGPAIEKNAYGCEICGRKDCFKKRTA